MASIKTDWLVMSDKYQNVKINYIFVLRNILFRSETFLLEWYLGFKNNYKLSMRIRTIISGLKQTIPICSGV